MSDQSETLRNDLTPVLWNTLQLLQYFPQECLPITMSRVSSLAINAADHLVAKGRLDAAASILKNYLSTNKPLPEILQRLARILLAQGRSAEAVPYLERALIVFKDDDVEIPLSTSMAASVVQPLAVKRTLTDTEAVALDAEAG